MRTWQIPLVGAVALALVFLGVAYLSFLPLLMAVAMLATVAAGFMMRPDREIWYAWVETYHFAEDDEDALDLYKDRSRSGRTSRGCGCCIRRQPSRRAI
jgi:hypothetical protein